MEKIKDFLKNSDRLTEAQRATLVKLVWLLNQAPEPAREKALERIEPLLEQAAAELGTFMKEARAVNAALERALKRSS